MRVRACVCMCVRACWRGWEGGVVLINSEKTYDTSIVFKLLETTGKKVQQSPQANRGRSKMTRKALQDHKRLKT